MNSQKHFNELKRLERLVVDKYNRSRSLSTKRKLYKEITRYELLLSETNK